MNYLISQRAQRVVMRFCKTAGLKDQLETRVQTFLSGPLDIQKGKELAQWLENNFYFLGAKTPKGGKELKETLKQLHWWFKFGMTQHSHDTEKLRPTIENVWGEIKTNLPAVVKLFSEEGGKVVPKEMRVGANTYLNLSGFTEDQLNDYIKGLEQVFDQLKDWRKKALGGGLKIALAGSNDFHGTSAGKYKSEEDTLYVRATPNVLKRTRGSYGAFDYIIVHELGHRYYSKRRPDMDFDKPQWWTSKYSRNEGEAFAELFAISNFDIRGSWDRAIVDKFEDYMTTGKITETEPVELPPHLQQYGQPKWITANVVERYLTAKYKEKKKVQSQDGGQTTVYVYSDRQVAHRNREKAKRLAQLEKSIADLRAKVKKDLKSSDPNKCLTALAVALIDHTYERVGNEESASGKATQSGEKHFGVTGWKKRHIRFKSNTAHIHYTGKSGVKQHKKITDTFIRNALRDAYEAVEDEDANIFTWDGGKITAEKVNCYLEPFGISAKDLRGWHANDEMKKALREVRDKGDALSKDKKERTKQLKEEFNKALKTTAQIIGHEAETLRTDYLIPGLEKQYLKDGYIKT